jgi:deazaflavin-dependent oxidoreductase (nitroreductase family)
MTAPTDWADERYCYLTTNGRVSGEPRTIEIWFGFSGKTVYMLAGDGAEANWVKNAVKTPKVAIRIRDQNFSAQARLVIDIAEAALARRLLSEKYANDPWTENARSLADWAQNALPMAFDLL